MSNYRHPGSSARRSRFARPVRYVSWVKLSRAESSWIKLNWANDRSMSTLGESVRRGPFFAPNRGLWLRIFLQTKPKKNPNGRPMLAEKEGLCLQMPSSLRFSCGLRVRSMRFWFPNASSDFPKLLALWKLHLLHQDTIVLEQFNWSTVGEKIRHVPSRYHRLWAIHVVYGWGIFDADPHHLSHLSFHLLSPLISFLSRQPSHLVSLISFISSSLFFSPARDSNYIYKLPIIRPWRPYIIPDRDPYTTLVLSS